MDNAVSKETGLPVHQHWKMLLLLIVLTIFDTLFCSVLLFYYSDTYANYINQATGTMYIMMSTAHRRLYAAAQRAKQRETFVARFDRGIVESMGERPHAERWMVHRRRPAEQIAKSEAASVDERKSLRGGMRLRVVDGEVVALRGGEACPRPAIVPLYR